MTYAGQGIPADQIELLRELSTDETGHSGRSLLDHLVGTRGLLLEWGNPDAVVTAGLFHSIYGTQYFRVQSASLDRRPEVERVAGPEAEGLAYLFCVTDRTGFFAQAGAEDPMLRDRVHDIDLPVTQAAISQLIEIEVANIVEQVDPAQLSAARSEWVGQMIDRGSTRMSPGALAALGALLD